MSSSRVPRGALVRFGAAFGLLFALSAVWAIGSPPFSSPDENAHAVKAIAAARGDFLGHAEPDAKYPVVDLPAGFAYPSNILCFAYHPETPASCSAEIGEEGASDSFSTWVARYNPVYYVAVGWPSLVWSGEDGLIAMRLMSAALCSALLAAAVTLAFGARHRSWAVAGMAFLASPMVMYLASAISPQGLEIAAAALLWVALPRLLAEGETHAPPRALWVAVVIAGSALALARALGPLWVVLIVGFCLATSSRAAVRALFRRVESYAWMAVLAAAGLFSLIWTMSGGSLSGQADEGDAILVGGTFGQAVLVMLRATPANILQSAGVFGWLDTYLPALAYAAYFSVLTLLVVLSLTAGGRRAAIVVGALLIAAVAIPVIVQSASVAQTGIIWQGRYGMFWYIGVPILAASMLSSSTSHSARELVRPVSAVIGVGIVAYGFVAFLVTLRRYVVGTAAPIGEMFSDPQWEPPGGWVLVSVAMAVVSVAAVAAVLLTSSRMGREVVAT